ncbi:MAG: hypothetical protein C0594_07385 [Marinilabiliales bacterium]|nr:MAG: hypothetical protein C0594_07385 [Marinilabiliales bacterium]
MKGKILIIFLLISISAIGQKIEADLTLSSSPKDKLEVSVVVPHLDSVSTIYYIPMVIPGSYASKKFIHYIDNFKAFDNQLNELSTSRLDEKSGFLIQNADKLHKITYTISDTWDNHDKSDYILETSGTNFEDDSVFLINFHAVIGYFDTFRKSPYEITIHKKTPIYGSTSAPITRAKNQDQINTKSYAELIDNPVLYCIPDTISFQLRNTRFFFSVYSRNRINNASQVADITKPLLKASFELFTDSFPMQEYSFLLFMTGKQDSNISNGRMGALEHKNSSFYFFPEEIDTLQLRDNLQRVILHEFLHIITPISLHSKEIHNFNYNYPKMSKHLWLYEGVIEYLSGLLMLHNNLKTTDDFIMDTRLRIVNTSKHSAFSMTEMSTKVLTKDFSGKYRTVYTKGALYAFCMDILIQEGSQGKYSLSDLLMELYEEYKNHPFDDDNLFTKIEEKTNKQVKKFIDNHIIGDQAVQYDTIFNKIGWIYKPEEIKKVLWFGDMYFSYDTEKELFIAKDSKKDENAFGLMNGDIILSIDQQELKESNYKELFELILNPKSDKEVIIDILRDGKENQQTAKPIYVNMKEIHEIYPNPDCTKIQYELRNQLLHNKSSQ